MRVVHLIPLSLLLVPRLLADPLTQADREVLLEKLEKIQASSDARVAAKYRSAVAAFRSGAASEEAAMELFLRCTEKVQFDEQHKKSQDFREWKRKEEAHLSDMAFKRALQYQLRWLILTLQVASKESSPAEFGREASSIVDDLMANAKNLEGQAGVLREAVTGTVFARAYELTNVKVQDWPMAPGDLQNIYDKAILPPLRNPSRIDALRAAWTKRIQQDVLVQEILAKKEEPKKDEPARIGMKDALRSPEQLKYAEETYPDLLWQMEVDVYKAGDQRNAALRMLQHLEKYTGHAKARDWSKQFNNLLNPPKEGEPEETTAAH
jgi:hypothetical protein